ncbi:hypothetical protein COW36_02345 [bacterium (Candidatus Blackallbacteria) CG17_big_fil_post_rev_8_21_14_2_50_48_46]|uniref:Cyanophycinase n=1 Tax=bacterium (Candidatus Blackallbacteria) CG17_big_fil_post_rev_8_21_14_2_50_48_46 TaxID=2014261 RepID=A0A2M7G9Z5_9BACT|nr:MAG: hypothetical protein COW64_13125 [bacterium (Candidatus Blackallbacteria) CG18_big_fil_WC_8_21_14_2_50_49_26]PIW18969.1 MAG: hypothetical protein COW36_02345 [bacterium (Candidatus Blackallbacteria) CG17_big_fil_post_rev_8_21_14_2_50_48_46]PIW44663.1 MAG: hypothetical protein COW20_23770 [bacterium (Candidatus Blackallbacteria) CG13_big_fil_rev_8_21_14_2_50_49_14]
MFPTALIYSSHNRSEEIHRWWIVERALKDPFNKTVLYLPMSMGSQDSQEYSWGTFRWYFEFFRKWGLEPRNFYWNDQMSKADVDLLFDWLVNTQVVILGGGSSTLGRNRYNALGERYYGDPYMFERILHERQDRGLLTVGFSAGADQLCSYMMGAVEAGSHDVSGFGLAHNVMCTLHHEWGREGSLKYAAARFPSNVVFGLPNDSALAVDQGFLDSGNIWQLIEFVVDTSWDIPNEQFHIKTRQGMNIDHYYADGRHWTFKNGDKMVRVMSQDDQYHGVWVVLANGQIYDYWSQNRSLYPSIEAILASH